MSEQTEQDVSYPSERPFQVIFELGSDENPWSEEEIAEFVDQFGGEIETDDNSNWIPIMFYRIGKHIQSGFETIRKVYQ